MEWNPPGKPVPRKTRKSDASASVRDRRSEERFEGAGKVELRFSNPAPQLIEASLLDYSRSGFRASHKCHSLEAGQLVDFRHPHSRGQARVMWNRISSDGVETGFHVLGF